MNKKEFSDAVAADLGLSKAYGERIAVAVIGVISQELVQGGHVKITNFGKFHTRTRKAKIGRNPFTNEQMNLAAKVVPHFLASPVLKNAVANNLKVRARK